MNVYLLLPAYNEEQALPRLLENLATFEDRIIHVVVVDDGSTDRTAAVVETFKSRLPLELLRHERNRGLGSALRTGLTHLIHRLQEEDAVVVMDADDTHPYSLIPEMLTHIRQGCDLVLASRFVAGGSERGLSRHRTLLSHGANFFMRWLFPIPGAKEYTCSFRAYREPYSKKLLNGFKTTLSRKRVSPAWRNC